jgi:transposase
MCVGNPKAEFSFNQKEKRTDCRQIVAALMLDGDGFIRGHRVFNGKMSDSKSLKVILNELEPDFKGKETPTIVFDRGVVSKENLELLRKYENLKYVIMCRPDEEAIFEEDFKDGEFKLVEGTKSNVAVSLRSTDDAVYVLCKSERRNLKETAMRNNKELKFEEELKKIAKQVDKTKKDGYKEIERRIGRLKEKFSTVAKYYEIEYTNWNFSYAAEKPLSKRFRNSLNSLISKIEKNEITFNGLRKKIETILEKYSSEAIEVELRSPKLSWSTIDEKYEYEKMMDGNYLLKTNRTDLEEEAVWKLYIMMTRVEDAFRDLKSYLGLRPNYHQKEMRVEGHIFISILAYHLLHSIEYTLRMKGDKSRWSTVKRLVNTHAYSTIQLPTTQGTVINIRKPGITEGIHQALYEKLEVELSRLPTTRNLA